MSESTAPLSGSAEGAADPPPGTGGTTDEDAQSPAAAANLLFSSSVKLARDIADLAAAEVRLAALSGVTILMLVIVAAVLIIVAWVFVAAVLAYVLVGLGLPWPAAGLLVAAVHAGVAYFLWRRIVGLSRSLTLPELRRSLLPQAE